MDHNPLVSEIALSPNTTAFPQVGVPSLAQALLRDLIETVLPALLIAIVMVTFVVQPTQVEGISMEPTLHSGQRLVIEKVSYRFRDPAQGDVVVLRLPGREETPLIKRVIAGAGDVVAIRDGVVSLNGKPLTEPYLDGWPTGDFPSTVVPEGYLFVLGDNRAASNDSRTFGMVAEGDLVGQAVFSYWPPQTIGPVE